MERVPRATAIRNILAFSVAMRAPLPHVKQCSPCGGLGAILLQEGLQEACLGALMKVHKSLCVPHVSHIPLDISMVPNPDTATTPSHPCKIFQVLGGKNEKHPTAMYVIMVLFSQIQGCCNTHAVIQDIHGTEMQKLMAIASQFLPKTMRDCACGTKGKK